MKNPFNPILNKHQFVCPNPECGKLHTFCINRNRFTKCKCGVVFFTKAFPWSLISKRDVNKMKKYSAKTA